MVAKRMISQKALETAFPGKGKALRGALTRGHAVIETLNGILGGHGVEYIPAGRGHKSLGFHYVNFGDPYITTIVRFDDGRYRIASWGSIVERGNYD
jgi:hypothetical protein